MSEQKEFYRGYIKGYEEGLNQAWDELIGLTTRGYSPREIQVVAKSKRQSLAKVIRDRKNEIKEETGVDLTEAPRDQARAASIQAGHAYIVELSSVTRALSILNEITSDGTKGLCILRSFPGNFEGALNDGVKSYWLTKNESAGRDNGTYPTFSPSEMARIVTESRTFMSEEQGGVVLLEGIEYLIVQNDLNGVLKFLQSMIDQTVTAKGVLLLGVYPSAIDDKALSNLKCNIHSIL